MEKYILIALFAYITVSCSNNNESAAQLYDTETITVDIRKSSKSIVDFSFMLDTTEFEIIPLETTDECLIANVSKLFFKNNKVVVYDELQQGAFIFNKDGSFYSKIRNIGNGTGEYPAGINDIFASEHFIYVLDPPFGIMQYDFDGKFIKKLDMQNKWGYNMLTVDDKTLMIVNDWSSSKSGCFHLFEINYETNRTNSLMPFSIDDYDNHRGWGLRKYYSYNKNNILLFFSSIDTIYELKDHSVLPKYSIDIIYRNLPDELKKGNGRTALTESIRNEYLTGVNDVVETSRYLFLRIDDGFYHLIYDKDYKRVISISAKYKIDSWKLLTIDDFHSLDENHIMTYVTGVYGYNTKKEALESKMALTSNFDKNFMKKLESINDEEANPIVVILKVKE